MKTLLTLLISLSLSIPAKAQWTMHSTGTIFDLFDLHFPGPVTGWAVGYANTIVKTTNSGLNWINQSFSGTADNINAVQFTDNMVGWVGSTNDTIYRTTNGGFNFVPIRSFGSQVKDIYFLNSLNGWVLSALLWKTTDAGASWTSFPLGFQSGSTELFFLNASTGYTTAYDGGGTSRIMKTTNGGANWTGIYTSTDFRNLYSVQFINNSTGWVCGYRQNILKTTNAGASWIVQRDVAEGSGLYSMSFINENTGWACGDVVNGQNTNLLYTTNGGSTWTPGNLLMGNRVFKMQFVNSNTGYAAAVNGKVYRTANNGGVTSVIPINREIPSSYKLEQNFPNPFNPQTTIRFSLPQASHTLLTVYSADGRFIETLVNETLRAGIYQYSFNASQYSGGVYFYKLSSDNLSETKKMVILK